MELLITLATLFVLGSVFGYVLEVFFRRFVSQHKWMNPGFMVGPYLPIYGFGVLLMYVTCRLTELLNLSTPLTYVFEILFITIIMTIVELIAGLIFIKGMGIKLWDYSDRWGNFKGIICPLFTLLWGICGVGYIFLVDPFLVKLILGLSEHIIYCFFVGIVIGAIIVDFAYSIHLGIKVSTMVKSSKVVVKYEEFKSYIKNRYQEENNGDKKGFLTSLSFIKSKDEVKEIIHDFTQKLPKVKKWWKKDNKTKE